MVVKNMLLATEGGLGSGETPIFPVQIFRVKEGVNYNPGRPELRPVQAGHALLGEAPVPQLQLPGRAVQPPVLQAGTPETEIAYMGCRTRVMGNVYDPDREVTPRARQPVASPPSTCRAWPSAAKGDLDAVLRPAGREAGAHGGAAADERFEIQARKKVYNCAVPHGPGGVDRLREAGSRRRAARGAQARHAVRGLHRPGGGARGAHRPASWRDRRRRRT